MKKSLLLFVASALSLSSFAQNATKSVVFGDKYQAKQAADDYKFVKASGTSNKTTAAGVARWYNHSAVVNELLGGALEPNLSVIPIWFDSTIQQRFSTGLGPINFISVAQYIDPIRFDLFNSTDLFGFEALQVTGGNPYKVDSVQFFAAYVENPNRPTSIVDTLILSVVPSNSNYNFTRSTSPWISAYIPSDKNNLNAYTVGAVDSLNRAALGAGTIMWKVLLTDADRTPPNTTDNTITLSRFAYAVPGGLNVPAGNGFAITATFKSGDTWTPNVDTINGFHRWMPVTYAATAGGQMPYFQYDINGDPYPTTGFAVPTGGFTDRNMSNLMFYFDSSSYYPSVAIEGWNTQAFRQEFHDISAFVSCPTCVALNVENIAQAIKAEAYPNPAAAEVAVPFTLVKAADVKVTLTNTVGQVVSAQSFNNVKAGKATFNVAGLANGVYFYAVEANGQTQTGRVAVSH